MQEGDTIDVKGPFGKFSYEGHGQYTLNRCVTPACFSLQTALRMPAVAVLGSPEVAFVQAHAHHC